MYIQWKSKIWILLKKVKDSKARREVTKYGVVPTGFYLIRSNLDHDSYSSLQSERSDKQNKIQPGLK